ncbi:MAG: Ig-like domain-containing protein [Phycisphaerae bacterium]|nr:Ig-like domain-containing protein [Phycisphaerae bacterium]
MKHALRHLRSAKSSKHNIQREKAPACPSLEALESRVLLSGSVLASVVHGNLNIRGDAAANVIALDQSGLTADQVRISGASGTTINNQADPIILSGVTGRVDIRMGAGADSVVMSNLGLPGNLSFDGQGGVNALTLNNVQVATSLTIHNGATITIANTTVGKDLMILPPAAGVESVALQSVEVQRNTKINSGKGADILTIDDSTFHGSAKLSTGQGVDVIQIDGFGDPLGPPTLFDGPVRIGLGAGNDTLQVGVAGEIGHRAVFADKAYFDGGAGRDILLNFDGSAYVGASRFRIVHFESNTPFPAATAPAVSSTDPANGATDVAVNKKIAAIFSEAMNSSTITAATFTVTGPGSTPVTGIVAYAGTTATFTPTGGLAPNTTFTATVTTGAQDLSGNALAGSFTWTFTTGATPDTTAPTVSSTDPPNGVTGVALNKKIAATFSEAMDPLTITTATVTVTSPGPVPVVGTVDYVGTTMTFTPTSNLAPTTVFTVTITTGATDLAGNPLAGNFVWTFTTGATPDTLAPTVSSTDPANSATGVALNKKIAATFSEAMDPLTITTTSFRVSSPGSTPVAGTVTYVGNTATFTPASSLTPNTTFTATITTGAKDLAGNALASNFTWTFTTGATPDTTAPTVTSTDPLNGDTGVALNKKIAATFSEAMDPLTITAANVTVAAVSPVPGPVTGTVAYVGATMTFTPTSPLAATTVFSVTITTGAKDLAGNPLASNFVWSFTTGATPDITAPTVTSTSPTDLQANVAINKTVAGTFSESMDPLTITTANFKVTGPGSTPVTGTVNYDAPSMTATFRPSSNLALNTTFTATITGGPSGVRDLAGNPLATDKVWTFTTGTQVAQAPINLGRASAFAVMATASINGGADQINGDVGLNPGSAQGIPQAQINGAIHVDDQAIIDAQTDLLAAYNDAVSRSVTSISLPGNMGGLTFTPGLYTNSTSVLISGPPGPGNNVTLDAQGDPNAIFIFKMGSTLTVGVGAQVILAGGAKAGNIFWQVGTSATLNTTTIFYGNILAAVTITVNNGSVVVGRLLGGSNSDGSVTVNGSTVSVPSA